MRLVRHLVVVLLVVLRSIQGIINDTNADVFRLSLIQRRRTFRIPMRMLANPQSDVVVDERRKKTVDQYTVGGAGRLTQRRDIVAGQVTDGIPLGLLLDARTGENCVTLVVCGRPVVVFGTTFLVRL